MIELRIIRFWEKFVNFIGSFQNHEIIWVFCEII